MDFILLPVLPFGRLPPNIKPNHNYLMSKYHRQHSIPKYYGSLGKYIWNSDVGIVRRAYVQQRWGQVSTFVSQVLIWFKPQESNFWEDKIGYS